MMGALNQKHPSGEKNLGSYRMAGPSPPLANHLLSASQSSRVAAESHQSCSGPYLKQRTRNCQPLPQRQLSMISSMRYSWRPSGVRIGPGCGLSQFGKRKESLGMKRLISEE